jgi:hypothetical protein
MDLVLDIDKSKMISTIINIISGICCSHGKQTTNSLKPGTPQVYGALPQIELSLKR